LNSLGFNPPIQHGSIGVRELMFVARQRFPFSFESWTLKEFFQFVDCTEEFRHCSQVCVRAAVLNCVIDEYH